MPISQFKKDGIKRWEEHSFKGSTEYTLVSDDKNIVLRAHSQDAASGLVLKKQIDLEETPYINWRWKIDSTLQHTDETIKEGDDFVARVYIIVDGGLFFWRTLALNYVWAGSMKKSEQWPNPFSSNAVMIAVESGNSLSKQWVQEKRNVRADLRKAYKRDIRFIDAVAILSDTDNSGQTATAYFHRIFFSKN